MGMRVHSKGRWGLAAGALSAAVIVLSLASPAMALPPPGGTQATGLLFGGAQLQVTCPVGTGPLQAGPAPFAAGSIAGSGVSVCDANAANAVTDSATFASTGITVIGGATFSNISASCTKGSATTGGAVTTLSGVAGAPTTYTTTTTVTDVNGNTLLLNEVINDGTFVTRNAIRVLTGPNAGAIIGQVICPLAVYPLAVDSASPAGGQLPFSTAAASGSGRSTTLLIAGAIAALLLSQVGVALYIRRRRATI